VSEVQDGVDESVDEEYDGYDEEVVHVMMNEVRDEEEVMSERVHRRQRQLLGPTGSYQGQVALPAQAGASAQCLPHQEWFNQRVVGTLACRGI